MGFIRPFLYFSTLSTVTRIASFGKTGLLRLLINTKLPNFVMGIFTGKVAKKVSKGSKIEVISPCLKLIFHETTLSHIEENILEAGMFIH